MLFGIFGIGTQELILLIGCCMMPLSLIAIGLVIYFVVRNGKRNESNQ
jgi:hypothetical protein